ncbi:IclR family transcriptional regulator [Chelatococcus asaccharovorans]|uniref:IclR family transcriptional regulator n=1 Tax=Chelatococcus asaccharovorans TaxID=28210 RepID=UPI00224C646C|nr:IclR family transcriptional regulator [Chelatococcus asaccharovorans]CAH1655671.1 IclR family transcriptional regulator [Chelatococcus asaccharovorans]CAH1685347.1 IclR family transcriptional regulator [Chelatococcus asaccharovorans]
MENEDRSATDDKSGVRSVARALALLSALDRKGKNLSEMAAAANISVSTASRLLGTLVAHGFAAQGSNHRYVAGLALTTLLHETDRWAPLRMLAADSTAALCAELDETSAFFVQLGDERLCIDSAESSQLVRRVRLTGEKGKIYRGAAGKALLAFSTNEAVDDILGDMVSFEIPGQQDRTVEQLKAELALTRTQGYGFSHHESTGGSWSVAAPVFIRGKLVGALASVIPDHRFDQERLAVVIEATKRVAAEFSESS